MRPLLFADDQQFWFETLRSLGHTAYGGADFGEVVSTAEGIAAGDYDGWHDQWLATADRIATGADKAAAAGHRISARDGFLRASNYYRSAEFFLHGRPDDPRIAHAYERSVTCFRIAAGLAVPKVEPVEIPYEGTTLPGYFYRGSSSGATVVMCNGFDGTVEEMHFYGAAAAVEREYNVLSFAGPGQPGPRHRDNLRFRPDWEHVVGPVIDYALTRTEVDPNSIALLGVSMGGELMPRAAAFESRVNALVALDGVYDLGDFVTAAIPGDRSEIDARLRTLDDPELDATIEALMAGDPTVRWMIEQGMWAFLAPTPRAFCAAFLDYHLRDGVAEQIACPTLVCSAEDDLFFRGQPERLFEHLTCKKTLLTFTNAEGAGAHCQSGAQRLAFARIYDWLDEVLGRR
ncbi:alpha/beta hydrolase family protein [Dactylosporangium sp. NPDC051541]|uniref:alpha/beta hydrolase family protein n=1 Tax=Dactylosporangium sp. NPDC051541 TaxID=3363977 RepID=UPI0037AFBF31